MSLIQIRVDQKLKKAIQKKAAVYDVPASSLIKIVLARSFLGRNEQVPLKPGNVFNADRDAKGKGIPLDTLLQSL